MFHLSILWWSLIKVYAICTFCLWYCTVFMAVYMALKYTSLSIYLLFSEFKNWLKLWIAAVHGILQIYLKSVNLYESSKPTGCFVCSLHWGLLGSLTTCRLFSYAAYMRRYVSLGMYLSCILSLEYSGKNMCLKLLVIKTTSFDLKCLHKLDLILLYLKKRPIFSNPLVEKIGHSVFASFMETLYSRISIWGIWKYTSKREQTGKNGITMALFVLVQRMKRGVYKNARVRPKKKKNIKV